MELPDYLNCPQCLVHFSEQPFIVEAFASVGIEHGKSTAEMARLYFAELHERERHGKRKRRKASPPQSTPHPVR